jgi:hypothetical protein
MIRSLLARDLKLIARDPAFRVVSLGYLLVFLAAGVAFCAAVLTGSEQETRYGMTLLYPRITWLQNALLACITPWIVIRLDTRDGGEGWVRLCADLFAMPWQVTFARILALAIFLAELLCLSLPVFSVVLLLGAATVPQVVQSFVHGYLFLLFLALIVAHIDMIRKHWALSWVLSYALLPGFAYGWQQGSNSSYEPLLAPLFMVSMTVFGALLLLRANRSLIYLI